MYYAPPAAQCSSLYNLVHNVLVHKCMSSVAANACYLTAQYIFIGFCLQQMRLSNLYEQ
jgi:hypothetical protein